MNPLPSANGAGMQVGRRLLCGAMLVWIMSFMVSRMPAMMSDMTAQIERLRTGNDPSEVWVQTAPSSEKAEEVHVAASPAAEPPSVSSTAPPSAWDASWETGDDPRP